MIEQTKREHLVSRALVFKWHCRLADGQNTLEEQECRAGILDLVLNFIDKMGTNCAPLLADLFLFCYERDFMKSLTKEKKYDLIDAFNSTSRYLDDLLNKDNIHFEHMVHRIHPAELQLNKANASDTDAAFLDLNLSIHNDKRDDFNFDIVNFPFLDGDVP